MHEVVALVIDYVEQLPRLLLDDLLPYVSSETLQDGQLVHLSGLLHSDVLATVLLDYI